MYRAGIVGCGRIGCAFDDDPNRGYVSTHAGAYFRTEGVELVALADVNEEVLERYCDKFKVQGHYTDYRRMLAEERLDILSICTWNDTHRGIVNAAVENGVKAIFCEKPIAESLKSADAMIKKCADNNVILMIDHQRRFDRFHQEIASYLKGGRLGKIQQVTSYYTAGVANTGTHLFDLLLFFFGKADWVEGFQSNNPSPNSQDPNIDGLIRFSNGLLAVIQACDVSAYTIFETNIMGTQGRLRVANHGYDLQFEKAEESKRFAGLKELYPDISPINSGGTREFMLQAVKHLMECLERHTRPISSGEDGRRALEIICAMRESVDDDGRRIDLPLKDSSIIIQSR